MKRIKNTNSNKKIALIGTTAASFYGFRADLILDLVAKGHEVYAFTSEYQATCLEKIAQLGAQPVTYRLSRGGLNPFADLASLKVLTQLLKKIQPDIVFSFFAKPVIYGAIAAHKAAVPLNIGMLEGLGYTFTEQPNGLTTKTKIIRYIQVMLYRYAFPYLDDLIFLNSDDQTDLVEKHQLKVKKTHILGAIGLDLSTYAYRPVNNLNCHFLFIGRLLKEKGIFELIEAIRVVRKKHPHIKVTVLGAIDHANLGALTQSDLDALLEEQLFDYPGHVSDVKPWIEQCSVFVLPSYREGVPRSTQEAMAMGRPVITTDVPGCRETVIDGVNGFLVPKWDAEALAERMCFFVENSEQVNLMGQESYRIAVDKFDARKANQKLLAIMGLSGTNEKTG